MKTLTFVGKTIAETIEAAQKALAEQGLKPVSIGSRCKGGVTTTTVIAAPAVA